jgi:hypothetical protein
MLTSGQCVLAAYMTDGGIVCVECAQKRHPEIDGDQLLADAMEQAEEANEGPLSWADQHDVRERIEAQVREAEEAADLRPLIEYELSSDESFAEDGCYCDDCGKELVEPDPQDEEEIEMDEETQELDEHLGEQEGPGGVPLPITPQDDLDNM